MCGVSGSPSDLNTTLNLQQNLHVTHIRRYIMWKYAQPYVSKATFEYNLTVGAVQANPQKYVYDWANNNTSVKWSKFDTELAIMCPQLKSISGTPIAPILEVFEGTVTGLPSFTENKTQLVDPCNAGVDAYLAHSYRWVRAVTNRYTNFIQNACGVKNPIYQIENEFNEAALSIQYGQRRECQHWANWTFLTQSLATLRQAVKDETGGEANSPVFVTQNLHTDVPEFAHKMLKLPGFYTDAVLSWNHLVDIWSLDAYPNMIIASPMRAYKIQERISNVTALTNGTKKVFIMETGFPRLDFNNASALPPSNWSVLNFSPSLQARYSELAIQNAQAAGGAGIFFFKVSKSAGMEPPKGGYLPDDLSLFTAIQKLLETHNVASFTAWVLAPFSNHLTLLMDRAGIYLWRPDSEDGWALLDQNGNPTPAYDAIGKQFSMLCG